MSAECDKHGCDLVGHEFSPGGLQCPECVLEDRLHAYERAITEHRTAIHNAGTVKVYPGYEATAEAKHRADERLWSSLREPGAEREGES